MKSLATWFADLPPLVRWASIGAVGLLVVAGVAGAVWSWVEGRELEAARLVAPLARDASQAIARGERSALDANAEQLRQFLKDRGRSRASAEAWYLLGNVDFKRDSYDSAATAYAEASRRGPESLTGLSRLGLAYTREAKGDFAGALEAVNQALQGRSSKDFAYPELLMAKARIQTQLKDSAGAVETYRRFLRDLPTSARGEEVRGRLALLGASS